MKRSPWRWPGPRTRLALLLLGIVLGVSGSAGASGDLFKTLQIERFTPPRPAKPFALPTLEGQTTRLADFRGKVVVLNFWATWCPACREEMPSMERLHREFKDRSLVVLAVDLQETRDAVAKFMKEFGLTFPVLLDRDAKVSDSYAVRFIPTTYLVGKDGQLVGRVIGPKDWASDPARRLVTWLLDPDAAPRAEAERRPKPIGAERAAEEFLERHWSVPIPPQGKAPAKFTAIEASLDPQSCGTCHPPQYADWKTSLHARAMGPGLMGQLVDMMRSDPDSALDCQRCHSPLAEQQEKAQRTRAKGDPVFAPNPVFDRSLRSKGLVCAACHLRKWERFGPPRRDGSLESGGPRDQLPHNGVTRTPAFLRSEFCQGCHQFPADGFALNGKLVENTYEEWKASPYARQGIQCQDCHMPDRRHLWRGVHDPTMVKNGVAIDLKTSREGNRVRATLAITNSGAGHYFPTYLTPKVFLRMELVDARGRPAKGTLRQAIIGRDAPLDLSRELYDTRLAPKASFTMKESWKVDRPGLRLRARVVVEPDHFYTRFFQSSVRQADGGTAQLREALRQTRQSSFTIFSREVPL